MTRVRFNNSTTLRIIIVLTAIFIWAVSLVLPVFFSVIPSEPGISVAAMGVLGAALAFPEIENFGARKRRDNEKPPRRLLRNDSDDEDS